MSDLLVVDHLETTFARGTRRPIRAVAGIDMTIRAGEFVGLVGESGCGKSTLGRTIAGLERPSAGRVMFDGGDLALLARRDARRVRRAIQYVFQDPYASINPRQTIGQVLDEALAICGESNRGARVVELLEQVGLAADLGRRLARELSGGQRQRVAIARALAARPRLLICDEPVSALDVSIRSQIMALFVRLQQDLGMAILFISHDLELVHQAADRVYVMYLGRIMEAGTADQVLRDPQHPYSQALLSATPVPDPRIERTRQRIVLTGELPRPSDPPSGCVFHTRCFKAKDACKFTEPQLTRMAGGPECRCIFHSGVSDLCFSHSFDN